MLTLTTYTIAHRFSFEDNPLVSVYTEVPALVAEMNTLIKESEGFMPMFLEAFNGFFSEITSEDILDMANPFLAYIEAKYKLLNPSEAHGDVPESFILEELHNGILFTNSDEVGFLDITCHVAEFKLTFIQQSY